MFGYLPPNWNKIHKFKVFHEKKKKKMKYFTQRELNGIFKRNYKAESQLAKYLRQKPCQTTDSAVLRSGEPRKSAGRHSFPAWQAGVCYGFL